MTKFRAYLQLLRPPNLITAAADILGGAVITWDWQHHKLYDLADIHQIKAMVDANLGYLILSSILLYGGGVVLNDYYDADLDRLERPERPIPSGKISRMSAGTLGFVLLFSGVMAASLAHFKSGAIAAVIALLVILYDAIAKKNPIAGPFTMGLCRGGNLLLGISLLPENVPALGFIAIIPVVYIMGVTWISSGEVKGTSVKKMNAGITIWILTAIMILSLGFLNNYIWYLSLPFLTIWAGITMPKLLKARRTRRPKDVGMAVKAGVLGLIVLNAALAAGFGGWIFGILLLLLLPLSYLIARIYAVT